MLLGQSVNFDYPNTYQGQQLCIISYNKVCLW